MARFDKSDKHLEVGYATLGWILGITEIANNKCLKNVGFFRGNGAKNEINLQ